MTLAELRRKIGAEKWYVDIRPFSHNIISTCLMQIAREYCIHEANRAIEDYGLERLGWKKEDDRPVV